MLESIHVPLVVPKEVMCALYLCKICVSLIGSNLIAYARGVQREWYRAREA